MKAGVATSEMWVSVVTSVVGLLVVTGKITTDEGDTLTKAIQAAIGAVITIASSLGYIVTRTQLKQSVVDGAAYAAAKSTPTPADAVTTAAVHPAAVSAAEAFHATLTKAGV